MHVYRLHKAKREAPPMEKPACIKTHMRNVLIMPEMIGSVVGIHNGKTFKEHTCSSDNDGMFQYASDDANLEMKDTGDHFYVPVIKIHVF